MAEKPPATDPPVSAELPELHSLAGELARAFGRSNAPLPTEYPADQVTAIARALGELDTVDGEDSQRLLVLARLRLREAGKILRINVRSPDAPGYFEVQWTHNALFVAVDALVAELPPATLLELQPPSSGGPVVVRRADVEGKIEALERRLAASERQAREALELADRPRVVLSLVYIEDLKLSLGNLIKATLSLSADLKATLVDLSWIAELGRRLADIAASLREAIAAFGRATADLADLIASAVKARALAERVVAGARALLAWVRRALRRGGGDGSRKPGQIFRDVDAPWCPEMVVIPAGRFLMGSPDDEDGRADDEGPQHEVTFARPFALGRFTVTFEEYDAFCAATGHRRPEDAWGRGRQPVINVSWKDATAYCRWLAGRTGKPYRLPSEAEWEYAARAGTTTPFWTGATISTDQANYNGHHAYGNGAKGVARDRTLAVDELPGARNPWGLHHVHGNVSEWLEDCYHGSYAGAPDVGVAWTTDCGAEPRRVLRGGSWVVHPSNLRAAVRYGVAPEDRDDVAGFRVARALTS